MTAEVDAVEAKAARDRDVFGRELAEEGPAVVRARSVALCELEQLVVDDDPGIFPLRKARAAARESR